MTIPKYGAFESNPARFTDDEAWVCQHDNVWREMNVGEVRAHAGLMTEDEFGKVFGELPPLPKSSLSSDDCHGTPQLSLACD